MRIVHRCSFNNHHSCHLSGLPRTCFLLSFFIFYLSFLFHIFILSLFSTDFLFSSLSSPLDPSKRLSFLFSPSHSSSSLVDPICKTSSPFFYFHLHVIINFTLSFSLFSLFASSSLYSLSIFYRSILLAHFYPFLSFSSIYPIRPPSLPATIRFIVIMFLASLSPPSAAACHRSPHDVLVTAPFSHPIASITLHLRSISCRHIAYLPISSLFSYDLSLSLNSPCHSFVLASSHHDNLSLH